MEPIASSTFPTRARTVLRVSSVQATHETIETILEEPLSLRINNQQVAVLMRLPGLEKELAAGFCISEGLIGAFDDILTIRHCGSELPVEDLDEDAGESRNHVDVIARPESLNQDARLDVVRLIRAGCGAVDVDRAELPLNEVASDLAIDAAAVLSFAKKMREAQVLHKHVGGVHAAALFDRDGELMILCEDVGRHNAVDKAIGHCLLRGIPLDETSLLCSGRLSYEMVTKAIRAGLPLLASVSAPTSLAVDIASRYGLTIVGYLRGGRMTIYCGPERIGAIEG